MFDVHCHLHDPRIFSRVGQIIARAKAVGVSSMVSCATQSSNFLQTRDLARAHANVLPCFGFHPWFLEDLPPHWEDSLEASLLEIPSGVGEIGLDFAIQGVDLDRQIQVFEKQLALARALNRPVAIHVRKAWDGVVHVLKRFGTLPAGGLIHSYSGSADLVRALEKYHLYFSFSGSQPRHRGKKAGLALMAVAPDRLLVETDAPDIFPNLGPLDPDPLSPGVNEPCFLPVILRTLAQKRGQSVEELVRMTYDNAVRLFTPLL